MNCRYLYSEQHRRHYNYVGMKRAEPFLTLPWSLIIESGLLLALLSQPHKPDYASAEKKCRGGLGETPPCHSTKKVHENVNHEAERIIFPEDSGKGPFLDGN